MGILPVSAGVGGVRGQEVGLVEIVGEGHDPAAGDAEGADRNLLVHGQDQNLLPDHSLNLEGEGPPHLEDQIVTKEGLGVQV